jgi:hypothetical protein
VAWSGPYGTASSASDEDSGAIESEIAAIAEPSTALLLALGLVGLGVRGRE